MQTNLTPRLTLDLSVRSVAWSPTDARTLLAVLDDDTLRVGDVSKGMQGPSRGDVVAGEGRFCLCFPAASFMSRIYGLGSEDKSTVQACK